MYLAALTQHVVICTTVFCLVWFVYVCVCFWICLFSIFTPTTHKMYTRSQNIYHILHIHTQTGHTWSYRRFTSHQHSVRELDKWWQFMLTSSVRTLSLPTSKANDKQTNKFATCSVLSLIVCAFVELEIWMFFCPEKFVWTCLHNASGIRNKQMWLIDLVDDWHICVIYMKTEIISLASRTR